MVNDIQSRVFLRRPTYDLANEELPAIFLTRRVGGGTTREQGPGTSTISSETIVIFDAVGIVRADADSGLAAEGLLADMQRALEIAGDTALFDRSDRKNLLSQELQLVSVELDPYLDALPYDMVGVGIQCAYPHVYGDPDCVT